MTTVFVTPDKLERNGRFIDARFDLQDVHAGEQLYKQSHIKGAVYWDLERDLSDMTKTDGRHPLPEQDLLQQLCEQAGLQSSDVIYVYDQGGAPFASRVWWILKYAGFEHVYIVNGGFDAIVKAGFETETEIPTFTKTNLVLNWNETILASRTDVKRVVDHKAKVALLDARAAGRYRGEFEPLDPVAGHIPTAKNFDWEQLKDGQKLVVTPELLAKLSKEEEIIVYCGSGVTATPVYSVLIEAGYKNVKLYAGGYSDWVAKYPIEVGENE